MCSTRTYQLFWPHIVQDPLCILTVMTTLHDGEQQLGCIVLRVKKKKQQENKRCQFLHPRKINRKTSVLKENTLCSYMSCQTSTKASSTQVKECPNTHRLLVIIQPAEKGNYCTAFLNSYFWPKTKAWVNPFPSFKQRCRSLLLSFTPAQPPHLELQHQVHPLFPKWVDVIKDQRYNNINSIGLMSGNTILEDINKNV